jgi:hypothetical protein
MEKFDARAVMAARIAEECPPDRGAGHETLADKTCRTPSP